MGEKKELTGVKEFLEKVYGAKLEDPTPEEREQIKKRMERYFQEKREQNESRNGQKGI